MRYVADVLAFARLELDILVPLVAVDDDEYHHPFGFLNVTLVRLLQEENA